MTKAMKLNDILASLDETHEKVAEETCAADSKKDAEKTRLHDELKASLGKKDDKPTEKTAAPTASPAGDLEKIAQQIKQSEEELLVKEAEFYGRCVCDGFMARMQQYEKVASEVAPLPLPSLFNKQASEQLYQDDHGNVYTESEVQQAWAEMQQEKTAAQHGELQVEMEAVEMAEELIKEAADQGIRLSGEEALEKVAEHAFSAGFEDVFEKAAADAAANGIENFAEKVAEAAYHQGFEETMEKAAAFLREVGETAAVEALEKAAFDAGYADGMAKIAEAQFNAGYDDCTALLASIK